MRADSSSNSFKQVNENLIPAQGTPEQPYEYEFIDHGVEPGQSYKYYLEEVLTNGVRRPLSDPMTVKAAVPQPLQQPSEARPE